MRIPKILTPGQYIRAVHRADRTYEENLRCGGKHRDGTTASGDPLKSRMNNIRGRMGEVAVSDHLKLPWTDEHATGWGGFDVGGFNVRASKAPILRIELDDAEVPMIACLVADDQVLTTMTPEVIILGWAMPSEVREKGRADTGYGRLKHRYEEKFLHSLETLP